MRKISVILVINEAVHSVVIISSLEILEVKLSIQLEAAQEKLNQIQAGQKPTSIRPKSQLIIIKSSLVIHIVDYGEIFGHEIVRSLNIHFNNSGQKASKKQTIVFEHKRGSRIGSFRVASVQSDELTFNGTQCGEDDVLQN